MSESREDKIADMGIALARTLFPPERDNDDSFEQFMVALGGIAVAIASMFHAVEAPPRRVRQGCRYLEGEIFTRMRELKALKDVTDDEDTVH